MIISFSSGNKRRTQFEAAIKKSLWSMGPGEPCWLNISDAEFYDYYGESPGALTKQDGVLCVTIEAWGGRVYVTCPKFSGRSEDN